MKFLLLPALIVSSVSLSIPLGLPVYLAEKTPTRTCCDKESVRKNAQPAARVLYQIGPDGKRIPPMSHDELRELAVTL